jgi:hypothetical protein
MMMVGGDDDPDSNHIQSHHDDADAPRPQGHAPGPKVAVLVRLRHHRWRATRGYVNASLLSALALVVGALGPRGAHVGQILLHPLLRRQRLVHRPRLLPGQGVIVRGRALGGAGSGRMAVEKALGRGGVTKRTSDAPPRVKRTHTALNNSKPPGNQAIADMTES